MELLFLVLIIAAFNHHSRLQRMEKQWKALLPGLERLERLLGTLDIPPERH